MMMKKMMMSAMVLVSVLVTSSFAAPSLLLTPSTTSISPGDSFVLTVSLIDADNMNGITYWLKTDAEAGMFAITSRTMGSFTTYQSAGMAFPVGLSQDSSVFGTDLGSINFTTGFSGTVDLGTLTITSSASVAAGWYTFTPFDVIGTDMSYNEYDSMVITPAMVYVPEPVSVSLLAMGGLALLRRKFA
jgi:hypothetical protein